MATKKSSSKKPRVKKTAKLGVVPDEYGRKTPEKDWEAKVPARIEQADTRPVIITGLSTERTKSFVEPLSSETVAYSLAAAEGGDMSAQMVLFEFMEERDASLAAAMMTRKSAVVGLEKVMQPARNEDDADFKKAKEIADDVATVIEAIPSFDGVCMDILDATGKGMSVLEIDWLKNGSVCSIRHIPPVLYQFDPSTNLFFLERSEGPRPTEQIYPYKYPYKFIIHRPRMRSGHPTRAGILRTLAWSFVFRQYSLKDASVFCEVFGMPIRIGKYKRTAGKGDKAQLAEMLRQMASDTWAVISEETDIEFKDIVNRGQEPFSAFSNLLRSEYFLAVLGQEGTNVTNKYGTKGDTEIKQLVRQDILEADVRQLEDTTKRDLLFPIVMYRHGLDAARLFTPTLHWRYEPAQDLKSMADVDKIVLIDMGAGKDVRRKDVLRKYGWEVAPEGTKPEEMLVDPTPPPAPGTDAGGPPGASPDNAGTSRGQQQG